MEELQSKELCNEKTRHINERFERDEERIKKQEEMGEKLSAASITLTEILRRQTMDIDDHGSRLNNIEKKPSNMMDKIVTGIVMGIIAALVSFAMFKILNG